jgi:hypothetical protein
LLTVVAVGSRERAAWSSWKRDLLIAGRIKGGFEGFRGDEFDGSALRQGYVGAVGEVVGGTGLAGDYFDGGEAADVDRVATAKGVAKSFE